MKLSMLISRRLTRFLNRYCIAINNDLDVIVPGSALPCSSASCSTKVEKGNNMKKTIVFASVVLLMAIAAAAQTTTQKFVTGWDNFREPLNFTKSNVKWFVSSTTTVNKLTVTYNLVGVKPSKLYQVALNFFCSTFPATFGQFPNDLGAGACVPITRQGVTKDSAEVEVGVVLTDIHGNGSLTVGISPVPADTYELEFFVRDGAGCDISGGAGNGSDCAVDFQSPGKFGTATTIIVP